MEPARVELGGGLSICAGPLKIVLFSSIDKLLPYSFAVTKSGFPSPLKSPTAAEQGPVAHAVVHACLEGAVAVTQQSRSGSLDKDCNRQVGLAVAVEVRHARPSLVHCPCRSSPQPGRCRRRCPATRYMLLAGWPPPGRACRRPLKSPAAPSGHRSPQRIVHRRLEGAITVAQQHAHVVALRFVAYGQVQLAVAVEVPHRTEVGTDPAL